MRVIVTLPAVALVVLGVSAITPAVAEIKQVGEVPAATLLLPYFEVDLNPEVKADVDLYDEPGGDGNVIGMLRQGDHVVLKQCRDDGWCQIDSGWVWGEFIEH